MIRHLILVMTVALVGCVEEGSFEVPSAQNEVELESGEEAARLRNAVREVTLNSSDSFYKLGSDDLYVLYGKYGNGRRAKIFGCFACPEDSNHFTESVLRFNDLEPGMKLLVSTKQGYDRRTGYFRADAMEAVFEVDPSAEEVE